MKFNYVAFDRVGRQVTGSLECASPALVADTLRDRGLFSTAVVPEKDCSPSQHRPATHKPQGMGLGKRLKCTSAFYRHMHVLMSSGTPLVQSLVAAERQTSHMGWRGVIRSLRERVESGTPLATAMEPNPEYFDPVSRSLVAAGESSGNLAGMLERLAILTRKQLKLRSTIIGAMIYPCLLTLVAVTVTILMLMFILPRFSELFRTLDSPLPPTTKFLLALSDWLHLNWWVPVLGVSAGIVGFLTWIKRPHGKLTLNALALKLPKIGYLTRSLMSASIARLLGVLLESKLPLIEALKLTRQSAVIAQYNSLLGEAEDAVTKGSPMSSILAESDLITPSVQEALRNGEQSGQLGQPLVQMAGFLDEENEVIIKTMTSLLEPCILIVLGVIVGAMALSIFLPLFDLVSNASGGAK